jgi:hypothetical protein
LKAVNYTQCFGFGKEITLFLTQNIIQIVVLSTFEGFAGTITSYTTNITINFTLKPSKIYPGVSIGT